MNKEEISPEIKLLQEFLDKNELTLESKHFIQHANQNVQQAFAIIAQALGVNVGANISPVKKSKS